MSLSWKTLDGVMWGHLSEEVTFERKSKWRNAAKHRMIRGRYSRSSQSQGQKKDEKSQGGWHREGTREREAEHRLEKYRGHVCWHPGGHTTDFRVNPKCTGSYWALTLGTDTFWNVTVWRMTQKAEVGSLDRSPLPSAGWEMEVGWTSESAVGCRHVVQCRIYLRDKKTELADGLKVEGATEEGIKTDSMSFLYQQVRRQGVGIYWERIKNKNEKRKSTQKKKKEEEEITQKDTRMRESETSICLPHHPSTNAPWLPSSDTPWSLFRTQAKREGCYLFTAHPPCPEDPHRHPQVHEKLPSTLHFQSYDPPSRRENQCSGRLITYPSSQN